MRRGVKHLLFGPLQEHGYWSRTLWGSVAGLAACLVLVALSRPEYSPRCITLAALATLAAIGAAALVLIARMQPDCRLAKLALFPIGVGLLVAALGGRDAAIRAGSGEHFFLYWDAGPSSAAQLTDLARTIRARESHTDYLTRIEARARFYDPLASGLATAVALVALIGAIRTPARAIRWRALVYIGGVAALLAVEWLVPVLLFFPPAEHALDFPLRGGIRFYPLLIWGLAVDSGQIFGSWRPLARRPVKALAALAAVLIVVLGVTHRRFEAEYHYLKWQSLRDAKQNRLATAKRHLETAYRLWPQSRWIACSYAGYVIVNDSMDLIAREEFDAATDRCLESIRIAPRDPRPYQMIALAYGQKGRNELAIRFSRLAVRVARRIEAGVDRDEERDYPSAERCEQTLITCLSVEGSPESLREILKHLSGGVVGEVQVRAAKALARHRVREAVEPIRRLLESGQFRARLGREALEDALRQLEQAEPGGRPYLRVTPKLAIGKFA